MGSARGRPGDPQAAPSTPLPVPGPSPLQHLFSRSRLGRLRAGAVPSTQHQPAPKGGAGGSRAPRSSMSLRPGPHAKGWTSGLCICVSVPCAPWLGWPQQGWVSLKARVPSEGRAVMEPCACHIRDPGPKPCVASSVHTSVTASDRTLSGRMPLNP